MFFRKRSKTRLHSPFDDYKTIDIVVNTAEENERFEKANVRKWFYTKLARIRGYKGVRYTMSGKYWSEQIDSINASCREFKIEFERKMGESAIEAKTIYVG